MFIPLSFKQEKIISNGLVLHLDSADKTSYPGTGDIWYDLSGNNYDFSLINSPEIVDNAFAFTTNEYAKLEITSSTSQIPDLLPDNTSFSVEFIYKFIDTTTRQKMIGTGNYGRGGWNVGNGYNNNNEIGFSGYDHRCSDGSNCQYNRGNIEESTPEDLESHYYQVSYNMDDLYTYLYKDGILLGKKYDLTRGTSPNPRGLGSDAFFYIGLNPQGGWGSKKGYCRMVRFYNRALSENELKQNYNALKSRF